MRKRWWLLILLPPVLFWLARAGWMTYGRMVSEGDVQPLQSMVIATALGKQRIDVTLTDTGEQRDYDVVVRGISGDVLYKKRLTADTDWRAGGALVAMAQMDEDPELELIALQAIATDRPNGIIVDLSAAAVQERNYQEAPARLRARVKQWAKVHQPSTMVLAAQVGITVLWLLGCAILIVIVKLIRKLLRRGNGELPPAADS